MDKDIYYVYIHRRADTNEVFYVGKGKGSRANDKHKRNIWWKRVAAKAGGVIVEYVEKSLCNESALELEIELIKFYKDCGHVLCNLTDGGEGSPGYVHSEETRLKMSALKLGKPSSEAWKRSASKNRKGVKLSEEHREARSRARKGVPLSPKQVAAMKIPVECSNGMKFSSATDAGKWLITVGLSKAVQPQTAITSCCKGSRKTAYGFTWCYQLLTLEDAYD